jgi:transposase-like protein
MARKKHKPEEIVKKLREVEKLRAEGSTIGEAARQVGVTETTLHRWKNQFGDLSKDQAKRLKELETENSRLKKMVAEMALDNDALKELARGKF